MKYLLIENDGQVDPLAFTLMGASTKRGNDGQIGFFGSGNKYAVANLLRRNIGFFIYSGDKRIEPITRPVKHRDVTFNKISFRFGEEVFETSLTTEMGPKWEPWYILRELYCNALDEGGMRMQVVEPDEDVEAPFTGQPGKTRVYVELVDELVDVVNHWNGYFTRDRLDLIEHIHQDDSHMFDSVYEVKLYHKYDQKLRIYRKGILIYCGDEKAIFDYDIPSADINEERVLDNMWQVRRRLGISISAAGSTKLITKLMKGMDKYNRRSKPYFEGSIDFAPYMHRNEAQWKDAVQGLMVINSDRKESYMDEAKDTKSIIVSSSLAYSISNMEGASKNVLGVPRKGLSNSFRETIPTEEQRAQLDRAFEYLVEAGFDFGTIKIITVQFDDYAVCAEADIEGKRIFIGQAAFDNGVKFVANCLMEEHSHIISRMGDETRGMQNYLLSQWLNEIEKRLGQIS